MEAELPVILYAYEYSDYLVKNAKTSDCVGLYSGYKMNATKAGLIC